MCLRLCVRSDTGVVKGSGVSLARTLTKELQRAKVTTNTLVASTCQDIVTPLAEHASRVRSHRALIYHTVALTAYDALTSLSIVTSLTGFALGGTTALLAVRLVAINTGAISE